MCLTTRLTKPFIAKNDIVCYKVLRPLSFGGYVTPFLHIPVALNTMLEAESNTSYEGTEWEYGFKHAIEGGFIHAYLGNGADVYHDRIFKAIIPAGTEFYIDDDCWEICARKMFITDEEVRCKVMPDCKPVIRELFNDYFSDLFVESVPGVGIGYYYLSDGSYVNPKDITVEQKKDVIGIVSDVREGKAYIISLDETYDNWSRRYILIDKEKSYGDSDYYGKEHTEKVLQHSLFSEYYFPAFAWVNNYYTKGTNKGDWYLGASGEVQQMIINKFIINIAITQLTIFDFFLLDEGYWSSSETLPDFAVLIDGVGRLVGEVYKDNVYNARAFLCKDL